MIRSPKTGYGLQAVHADLFLTFRNRQLFESIGLWWGFNGFWAIVHPLTISLAIGNKQMTARCTEKTVCDWQRFAKLFYVTSWTRPQRSVEIRVTSSTKDASYSTKRKQQSWTRWSHRLRQRGGELLDENQVVSEDGNKLSLFHFVWRGIILFYLRN